MQTILIPLTLSGDSYPDLAFAGDLARARKAKLALLHVVQLNITGEERGIPRADLINQLGRNAEMQLRELARRMGGRTPVEILVSEGNPADAIVEMARRLRADAIVMRMHGHRSWLNWLHRNTALHVASQAPCRIWLLHPGQDAGRFHLAVVDPRWAGTNAGMHPFARPATNCPREAGPGFEVGTDFGQGIDAGAAEPAQSIGLARRTPFGG
jgi:nucleotide-binding universal stress UspA family protein